IYVGEPESMMIECPQFVSVNEQVKITWSVSPVGTYGTPTFTSSNESIVKVDAKGNVVGVSVGKATITATLGSLSKSFEIEVGEQKEVKGVKFVDVPNYFSVVKDSDKDEFKPSITKAQLLFVDNTLGPVFEFAATNVSVGELDTSVAGEVDVPVALSYAGTTYHSSIKVNVYEYYDQKVSEVGIVDWFIYSTFLQLPNTCTNIANLTGGSGMIPGLYDNISYTRADGTEVPLEVIYQLGANIALFPEFLFDAEGNGALDENNYTDYYLPGDMITVEAMTPVYKWTGDIGETATDNHAMAAGTGEIIVEGYIKDKLQYRYDGNVWGLYIQYEDIAIASDTVEVMIGQTKSAGATRVPSNATSGTFSYVSSDPSVATVTSGGVIKGISQGTCTITVTLSEEGRESKVGTITVNVVDGVKSLKIEGGLQVTQGTKELDLSKLDAKVVWASGKEEAADLSSATVSGYDPEKLGKQNVAIKVTVEGKELTAKIVVEVVAKKGCGGSIITTTGIFALVSTLGLVLVSKKKKEEK
ncbi:MAG: Ig-like domain-containing protein, partial [Bacilli bacterium]|nr:Ig-like domain-containing protein [Bacilli bacterium]